MMGYLCTPHLQVRITETTDTMAVPISQLQDIPFLLNCQAPATPALQPIGDTLCTSSFLSLHLHLHPTELIRTPSACHFMIITSGGPDAVQSHDGGTPTVMPDGPLVPEHGLKVKECSGLGREDVDCQGTCSHGHPLLLVVAP